MPIIGESKVIIIRRESVAVVNESKTSLGPEDSTRDNRSPYESPISWDKVTFKFQGSSIDKYCFHDHRTIDLYANDCLLIDIL